LGARNPESFRRIQIFLLTLKSLKFVNGLVSEGVCSLNNMSHATT